MAELNLIPYELRKHKSNGLRTGDIVLISVLIFCFIAAGIFVPLFGLAQYKLKERALVSEVKKGEAVLQESARLQQEINDLKLYTVFAETLEKSKFTVTDKVRGIEKYTPGDVAFDSLTWGIEGINITMKSKDYNSLCNFAANIQEAAEYKDARISSIAYNDTEANYTCVVSIKY